MLMSTTAAGQRPVSLVPAKPSAAPDYFCTWNIQGYVNSYASSERMRQEMNEGNVLGYGAFGRWVNFFPEVRPDLYFVLDDSWDIPAEGYQGKDHPAIGLLQLDATRFPSFRGTPVQRMKGLADSIMACGWKGLGLWVAAQKAEQLADEDETAFWHSRLQEMEAAGVRYWKVDWGRHDRDDTFRRQLADDARRLAPHLTVENAMKNEYVTFSDAFRTYDVENIIAQPVTIERVARLLPYRRSAEARGLVNCEDEPYIAVGLGCTIGVMRHPFAGALPDSRQDEAFPDAVRDLKRRLDEVIRGVRWHRIAEPFGVDGDCRIDTARLHDFWTYHQGESWVNHREGEAVRADAPARISRRMPLPKVKSTAEDRPYVLASRYPSGATALVAIGRTLDRSYISRPVAVEIEVEDWKAPVGLFGVLGEVTLHCPSPLPAPSRLKVWAQDLKSHKAVDVTAQVRIHPDRIVVPAALIRRIGLSAASPGDLSDPGMVLQVRMKE